MLTTHNEQLTGVLAYLRTECGLAPATLEAYLRDLELVSEYAGRQGVALRDASLELFRSFVREQTLGGMSSATISRRLASIRAYLTWLQSTGVDTTATRDNLEAPKQASVLPEIINETQVRALLAAPDPKTRLGVRDRAILEMLYASGLRATELCEALLGDCDLVAKTIRVKGKGGVDRVVPFHREAAQAVRDWLRVRGTSPAMTLFVSSTGHPLARVDLWRLIQKYAKRLNFPQALYPHLLRHAFATHMLSGGADLRVIQELMGHQSAETTAVYLHVDTARLKATHKLLGR